MAETFLARVKREAGHEIQFSKTGVADKCPWEYGLESERAVTPCQYNPSKIPWHELCRRCWEREMPTSSDNVDRCICCGEPVPEGRQICWKCEKEI